MTIEELKRRIAVQQAFVDGKTVQYKSVLSAGWQDYQAGPDDFPSFDWVYCDWRVKPEPRVIFVPEFKCGLSTNHRDEPAPWPHVVRWHRFVEDTSYGEER